MANLTLTLTFPTLPAPLLPHPGKTALADSPVLTRPHRTNDCTHSSGTHPASPLEHRVRSCTSITFTAAHVSCYLSASERCESEVSKWSLCIVCCLSCCVFFGADPRLLCLASQRYLRPISTIFLPAAIQDFQLQLGLSQCPILPLNIGLISAITFFYFTISYKISNVNACFCPTKMGDCSSNSKTAGGDTTVAFLFELF